MNCLTSKVNRTFLAVILGVLMLCSVMCVTSVKAHAIGDVDIKVSNDGQLTVNGNDFKHNNAGSAWTDFIKKYRTFIVGFSGIGAVSMILFFIVNLMKLGQTSGNPAERQKVIQGLVWTGLATAGLGSVGIIVGFFYRALS